eukprot:18054-Amphidinium_carterae.2
MSLHACTLPGGANIGVSHLVLSGKGEQRELWQAAWQPRAICARISQTETEYLKAVEQTVLHGGSWKGPSSAAELAVSVQYMHMHEGRQDDRGAGHGPGAQGNPPSCPGPSIFCEQCPARSGFIGAGFISKQRTIGYLSMATGWKKGVGGAEHSDQRFLRGWCRCNQHHASDSVTR